MKKPSVSNETATRLAEDRLYASVYEEIENGKIDKAAQARAIAEGGENDGAVRAAYIKHRIARIKAEVEISAAHANEHQNLSEEKITEVDLFKFLIKMLIFAVVALVILQLAAAK